MLYALSSDPGGQDHHKPSEGSGQRRHAEAGKPHARAESITDSAGEGCGERLVPPFFAGATFRFYLFLIRCWLTLCLCVFYKVIKCDYTTIYSNSPPCPTSMADHPRLYKRTSAQPILALGLRGKKRNQTCQAKVGVRVRVS